MSEEQIHPEHAMSACCGKPLIEEMKAWLCSGCSAVVARKLIYFGKSK